MIVKFTLFLIFGKIFAAVTTPPAAKKKAVEETMTKKQIEWSANFSGLIKPLNDRILSSKNIIVTIVGGSLAAGGHIAKGLGSTLHSHAHVHELVEKMNSIISTACPMGVSCGQFEAQNMAHGCTHTFHSAIVMDALVPADTDLLIWGHNVNDVEYDDKDVVEMMSIWLHSARLQCPKCILIPKAPVPLFMILD